MNKGQSNNIMSKTLYKTIISCILFVQAIFAPIILFTCPVYAKNADAMTVSIKLKDHWPPDKITDLNASITSSEGRIKLIWTAPDENENHRFKNQSPVSGYYIRYSTYSIDSLNNDIASWWNNASRTEIGYAGNPGESETIYLNLPLPGATYYFAVKSYDDALPASNISQTDILSTIPGNQVYSPSLDICPAVPYGITILNLTTGYTQIAWDELTAAEKTMDFDYYKVYRSTINNLSGYVCISTVPDNSYTDYTISGFNVNYYYRIAAVDKPPVIMESNLSTPVRISISGLYPRQPQGLTANGDDKKVILSWQANSEPNLSGYYLYRSTVSMNYGANPVNLMPMTTTYFEDTGLINGITYYYIITAINTKNLISPVSNEINAIPLDKLPPATPFGIKAILSANADKITITWPEVTTNEDGSDCSDLAGYRIYRASTINGNYKQAGFIPDSRQELSWTDPENIKNKIYYYLIRTIDTSNNLSRVSMIVNSSIEAETIFVSEKDPQTYLTIPKAINHVLYKETNKYGDDIRIEIEENTDEEYDKTIKSRTFVAKKSKSGEIVKDFMFPSAKMDIVIGYDTNNNYSKLSVKTVNPKGPLSMFWHNGIEWLKLGSKQDYTAKTVSIKSKHLGKFAIKESIEPTSFEIISIQPDKIFTPNNDGWNDYFEILYNNPNEGIVIGKIFDIKGALVVTMKHGSNNNALIWDGKNSDGYAAPSGVYIYQVEITGEENKLINGTCVIAK